MKYLLSVFTILIAFSSNAQLNIEGVTLPATLKASSSELVLNGGGLREKYFLDLYVSGLYLESKNTNADAIIKADEPMAIRIEIVSKLISSDKMVDAIEDGMKKSTGGNTEALSTEIAEFKSAFSEEIVVGDIYNLVYLPGEGFTVYKNDKKVKTIKGLKFKQAAFGIWLCDDPADDDLKEGMLKG
jgi:hypothetical protein